MNICMVVGVNDAVRVVVDALKRFAAPDKLPPPETAKNMRRIGDIDVFFDVREGHEGEARFYLVTHDNIWIDTKVDFKELTREYLDEIVRNVEDKLGEVRCKRNSGAALFLRSPELMQ